MDADEIGGRACGTQRAPAGRDAMGRESRFRLRRASAGMSIPDGRISMGSNGMLEFATEKDMEIRGSVGDWHALRSNPDYKADWRAHGGAPQVVESAGFPLRAQTEADREAARWGLLAAA